MKKLWGARFKKELAESAKKFSYSLAVDHELLGADIKTSMAHASMLGKVGLISESDSKKLIRGLWNVLSVLRKKSSGEFSETVEDIHTLIQETLEKKVGKLARKLHTGRSRNDLVATSTRLYLRDKIAFLLEKVTQLQSVLVGLAEKYQSILMPGYTHLQRAQIVSFSHHLLAYVEMLERDKTRLFDLKMRMNECPLGSGALAGSALRLDRVYVAKLLGFTKPSANSMDAVSDRDFVVEALSVISISMMHLSRLSEDVILWSSSEFGFVTLSDQYSTGSSLMPHKKNPDMLELVRGRTGAAYGNLVSVLTMMKGLPLAYNRDMQEDKKPLFASVRILQSSLDILSGTFASLHINKAACERAVNDSFLYATDLLEYLVKHKVAFRDAHEVVGRLVQYAIDSYQNLSGLKLETFQKFSDKFRKDVFDLFNPAESVSSKVTSGSTNPKLVKAQVARWKTNLKEELARLKKASRRHA